MKEVVIEMSNEEKSFQKTNINWYPGHMAKTKREMKENLEIIDIVYEVIDGRMPISSKILDIDEIIKNKKRILVVTKMDLCDLSETNKILREYEKKGYKVVPLDLKKENVNSLLNITKEYMKKINEKRKNKGLKERAARVLIIGVPNVGKSTLINRLVNKKAAGVGNIPGFTKSLNWIRINKDIELLDSPGILWPKFENEDVALTLAAMSSIKEEIINKEDLALFILNKIFNLYPDKLKERYNLEKLDEDILETYQKIGKKRGLLRKGGEVDFEKVIDIIIRDFKNNAFGKITFDRMK